MQPQNCPYKLKLMMIGSEVLVCDDHGTYYNRIVPWVYQDDRNMWTDEDEYVVALLELRNNWHKIINPNLLSYNSQINRYLILQFFSSIKLDTPVLGVLKLFKFVLDYLFTT